MRYRTVGLSPKLIGPIAAPLSAVSYQLAVTGTLDRPALGALTLGIIAAGAAYIAGPGAVETQEAVA